MFWKKDEYHTKDLIKNTFEDLREFTFDGLITKAKIVDVYDGDTVTIVFYYKDMPIKDRFRIRGYDSPELKPRKDIECRTLHINAAKRARNFLIVKLLNQIVWVKFSDEEKYGRLMGDIYFINPKSDNVFTGNEISISTMMLENGFGKQYGGGHKIEFTVDELKRIIQTIQT